MSKLWLSLAVLILTACTNTKVDVAKHYEWEYELPQQDYIVAATGYAPVKTQRGADDPTKMIKALKASKLDAYRDLTEKVYGHKISSRVKVADLILGDEKVKASVQGVIKGARVVKSYHLDGVYITELELNLRDLYRVRSFTNGQVKVVNSRYF